MKINDARPEKKKLGEAIKMIKSRLDKDTEIFNNAKRAYLRGNKWVSVNNLKLVINRVYWVRRTWANGVADDPACCLWDNQWHSIYGNLIPGHYGDGVDVWVK